MSEGSPITYTVTDDNAVSARQVKRRGVLETGWGRTRIANVVSKLNDKAGGGKSGILEGVSIPFLDDINASY